MSGKVSTPVKVCNCAGCGGEMLSKDRFREASKGVRVGRRPLEGRIEGRPYCYECLKERRFAGAVVDAVVEVVQRRLSALRVSNDGGMGSARGVEHIRRQCDGGTDDPANLTLLCQRCNVFLSNPQIVGLITEKK